jgi:hypothetical protein
VLATGRLCRQSISRRSAVPRKDARWPTVRRVRVSITSPRTTAVDIAAVAAVQEPAVVRWSVHELDVRFKPRLRARLVSLDPGTEIDIWTLRIAVGLDAPEEPVRLASRPYRQPRAARPVRRSAAGPGTSRSQRTPSKRTAGKQRGRLPRSPDRNICCPAARTSRTRHPDGLRTSLRSGMYPAHRYRGRGRLVPRPARASRIPLGGLDRGIDTCLREPA